MKNQVLKYFLISLLVIVLDQVVKMVVYYNMDMGTKGQLLIFGTWFKLHYLTNPGMAFGMKLDFEYGKLILTVFRIGAMIAIGYYLYSLITKEANKGLIICIALILGGAIGNLVDSIFYGVWFDNAPFDAPSRWFHGQVIDMFYIDIWEGYLPNWIPLLGGDYMALWPVFNIADAAIFTAICFIIVFQKRYFKKEETETVVNTEIEQTLNE
ncbi:lipoprotein signal peptidase [Ekhidna sp.]|uniref:lipoprotein signal peptidase n=1 Tax=Ekhidna sp. TaxID=2608089 RepID=UPI003297108E